MNDDVELGPSESLPGQLDRWVQLELISADQARRILSAEQQATAPPGGPTLRRVVSPVAEALGYVGGVLLVVAAVTITGQYWAALSVTGRVAIALGAAVLLLAVGAVMPQAADAGRRLRGVSWALSVVSSGFGIGLLGADVLDLRAENVTLLAGGVAAGYAAALWWLHRGVLQQAALLGALGLTAGSAAALLPGGDEAVVGLALWGVGLAWLLLGWGGLVRPWYAVYVGGGMAILVGAQLVVQVGWGSWLALVTVVGLVTAGILLRDLVLMAIGSVATLLIVPQVLASYFPDTLAAPLALLAVGALLVAVALYVARRGGRRAIGNRREGGPRVAVALASTVLLAVAAAVVGLGVG